MRSVGGTLKYNSGGQLKWGHAGSFSVQAQVHHMWGNNLDHSGHTHCKFVQGKLLERIDHLV